MSFKAMAWATEQEITETSPQSHLLLVMASYANEQNECYPSINTLVKKTRLSDKTIRKCLKDLLEMGLIFDTQKVSNFGAKVYLLNVENVADTPSNLTTPSNFTGGSKSSSTPLVDLPQGGSKSSSTPLVDLPQGGSKSSSTPLVDLPPNPIINLKNNHKDNHKYEYTHENPKNAKKTAFVKPSIDEVKTYFTKINPSTEQLAVKFFLFYEANGWVVGKTPMQNWQAAAQRWLLDSGINPTAKTVEKSATGVVEIMGEYRDALPNMTAAESVAYAAKHRQPLESTLEAYDRIQANWSMQ